MASRKPRRPVAPEVCPVCGEDVPRNALACPECGADHRSGWKEDADAYDETDLSDEFDYDEYVQREFGGGSVKPPGISTFWWVAAIVVIVALVVLYWRQAGL